LFVATRARNANGRILHFRVNPARVEMKCIICEQKVMKCRSDLRPGQVKTSCGPVCRMLAMSLWPLGDRRRDLDSSRTPPR
jgi:hypothetical protein